MLKNYLRIAFRNLLRHWAFSTLNILGLTIGMSACFLIFLYVKFELSYDQFHSKGDRIYRMVTDIKTPTETLKWGVASAPMAINAQKDLPEIEKVVRVNPSDILVRKGDLKIEEDHMAWVDSTFFEIFDFPLIYGNPQTALKEPFSVVLSETAAKKYFTTANPIGQTLTLTDQNVQATVTGIMKDMPENTQLKSDMLVSQSSFKRFDSLQDQRWGSFGVFSFLLLKPNTDPKALEKKFPGFLVNRIGKDMDRDNLHYTLFLEPLKKLYLTTTRGGQETGSLTNVYVFSIVGLFILLIACINFVNLTTARSTERAKEVGIRKVIGAERGQLTQQFLGESVLLCLIAFILSVCVCSVFLGPFNTLAGKTISTGIFHHPGYILSLLGIGVGIGLLAGVYPALVLSSFQPIMVLKGRFATGVKGLLLRKGLVIVQFTISIGLIVSTLIVGLQLRYMRSQDLGFYKDQMMVLDTHGDVHKKALKNEVARLPGVLSTAMSSSTPGGGAMNAYSQLQNQKGEMQISSPDLYFVDFDYIGQYKMKIIAGRAFSPAFGADTTQAMVLNETAVKMLGYSRPQDAVGRDFSQWGRKGKIIGILKDFHYQSLRSVIRPLSMRIEPDGCNLLSIHVRAADLPATVAAIEDKWKTLIPNQPFSYTFVDENFNKQYRSEDNFGKLFLNFAILAIFISCLGLLGLASYSTLQRTKEIGVRKVLGASVTSVVNLLSREFLILVGIAFVIATSLTWFLMGKWLKDFNYRIEMSWWIFLLAGVLAMLIALLTISFQAIKAAVANPIKSLRTE